MRIANLSGRLALVVDGLAVDVERASTGRFPADPQAVYERWEEFRTWAAAADLPTGTAFDPADLGSPAPAPRQLLAIGLNYRDHASESGFTAPEGLPPVFTKFATSITGPVTDVTLPRAATPTGRSNSSPSSAPAPNTSPKPPPGATSPDSPPARTSPNASPSSPDPSPSSASASPTPASPPSAPGSSPPTSSTTRTTSNSAAPSTAKKSRRAAPAT